MSSINRQWEAVDDNEQWVSLENDQWDIWGWVEYLYDRPIHYFMSRNAAYIFSAENRAYHFEAGTNDYFFETENKLAYASRYTDYFFETEPQVYHFVVEGQDYYFEAGG